MAQFDLSTSKLSGGALSAVSALARPALCALMVGGAIVSANAQPRQLEARQWHITVFDPCLEAQLKNCDEVSVVIVNQRTGSMETLRGQREVTQKNSASEPLLKKTTYFYRFNSPLMGERIISPNAAKPVLIELKGGAPGQVVTGRWVTQ